jgi:hypothetical protein
MRALVTISVVAALGCARGPKDCAERMERLEARLVPLAERPPTFLLIPTGFEPIEASGGRPVESRGIVLTVGADGSPVIGGAPVDGVPGVVEVLAREIRQVEELSALGGPAISPRLSVWLDRRASPSILEELLPLVPGAMPVEVLVMPPGWAPPEADPLYTSPSAVALRRSLDDADASEKAVILARRFEEAVRECKPLDRIFGDITARDAADKARFLAREAPRAVAGCGCKVADLSLFEYSMLAVMGAYDRPVHAIPAADWLGTR